MKQRYLYVLYKLLELEAYNRFVRTSTIALAKKLGVSQQTASRYLIELENKGYITRHVSFTGIQVKITDKGMEELRRVYLQLKAIIETVPLSLTIEGIVFTGLREGAYYVGQKGYRRQFERKVGFNPYPGTLNLKLSSSETIKKKELNNYPQILIKGFKGRRRLFGDVKCYPAIINNEVEGAAIIIDRTHYDNSIIEVIAPIHLRSKLNLKDGSKVILKF